MRCGWVINPAEATPDIESGGAGRRGPKPQLTEEPSCVADEPINERPPRPPVSPGPEDIDVTNPADIGPRHIRIGIEPADTDESLTGEDTQQALARTAEGIGSTGPVGDKPVKEAETLAPGFDPQGFEASRERGQPRYLNRACHVRARHGRKLTRPHGCGPS